VTRRRACCGQGQALVPRVAFQLLLLVVLARRLEPADFGVVQVTLVAIGLGQIFTRSIVGPALVQKPVIERRHVETAFVVSIVSSTVVAAAFFFLANPVSQVFGDVRLIKIMRVLQIGFIIQVPAVIAEAILQRKLQFRSIAIAQFSSYLAGYAGLGIVLGLSGAGVWSLIGAQLGQLTVYTMTLLAQRPVPLRISYHHDTAKELARFGGGFTFGGFFNYAALQGDYVVVGSMLSQTALGIYGRAYQILAAPAMLLGEVIDRVLFPMLAEIQHDHDRVRLQYQRAVALVALVMLPLSAFVVILAPEIVSLTLGNRWSAAITPLRILAVSLLARTSYKISDSLLRSLGLVYQRAGRQFFYAALVIIGALVGQNWGIPGVATAVATAVTVNFVVMAQLSIRAISMPWLDFAIAHTHGAVAAALLTPVLAAVTAIARSAGTQDIVTVLIAAAASGLALGAILMWRPSIILGPEIKWLASTI